MRQRLDLKTGKHVRPRHSQTETPEGPRAGPTGSRRRRSEPPRTRQAQMSGIVNARLAAGTAGLGGLWGLPPCAVGADHHTVRVEHGRLVPDRLQNVPRVQWWGGVNASSSRRCRWTGRRRSGSLPATPGRLIAGRGPYEQRRVSKVRPRRRGSPGPNALCPASPTVVAFRRRREATAGLVGRAQRTAGLQGRPSTQNPRRDYRHVALPPK